ncbi:MAG: glycosyltransferase family 2 protein [Chloroflexaceae bacterium]|nr:glycosyltransferase family 2 protein [Chloroflexaceae bacterium]
MNTLLRLRFPIRQHLSGLYWTSNSNLEILKLEYTSIVKLVKNDTLSFNSYFNSFYEYYYKKYSYINECQYELSLKGSFRINVIREKLDHTKELINTIEFIDSATTKPVIIPLKAPDQLDQLGRIYLELICISDKAEFHEGKLLTQKKREREVSLAIICCTYKREQYIKNTVFSLLADGLLGQKEYIIFIIDNGNTLDQSDFNNERVKLIFNRDFGASGGFSRGMIEALEEDNFSHFLFMDDDVVLDSESIFRIFPIYEYSKYDFAVCGAMLDMLRPHLIHDAGAKFDFPLLTGDSADKRPFVTSILSSLNHGLYLQSSYELNLLLADLDINTGGFWLFACSRQVIGKCGLLMPFFLKFDDIEFNLRLKKLTSNRIIFFPSFSVWHEPFYLKKATWEIYYYPRNILICSAIHKNYRSIDVVFRLTLIFLGKLFFFDYNSVNLIILATQHFLIGPEHLISQDPEKLHHEISALSNLYAESKISICSVTSQIETLKFTSAVNVNLFAKLFYLITLNGHLLPDFMLDRTRQAYVLDWPSIFLTKVFGVKQIVVYDPCLGATMRTMNRLIALKLVRKWIVICLQILWQWNKVQDFWKESAIKLTSVDFWKKYLGLQ